VSKGDLESDSPSLARVYEGRNEDPEENKAQYHIGFEEVGEVPHMLRKLLRRCFQISKEHVIWTCELKVMAVQS